MAPSMSTNAPNGLTSTDSTRSQPQALRQHSIYFIHSADLHFLIGNVQYKVHRYFFERESAYFRGTLALPASPGAVKLGSSDDPIVLEDVASEAFDKLLWVFYNPRYSLYDVPVDDYISILVLAHKWGFAQVKAFAVRELQKSHLSDIDRIVVYHANDVDRNLLIPCFAALCARENPLTLEEGLKLGMETTLIIASAREFVRAQKMADGSRTPITPTVAGEELENVIRDLFRIAQLPLDPNSVSEGAAAVSSSGSRRIMNSSGRTLRPPQSLHQPPRPLGQMVGMPLRPPTPPVPKDSSPTDTRVPTLPPKKDAVTETASKGEGGSKVSAQQKKVLKKAAEESARRKAEEQAASARREEEERARVQAEVEAAAKAKADAEAAERERLELERLEKEKREELVRLERERQEELARLEQERQEELARLEREKIEQEELERAKRVEDERIAAELEAKRVEDARIEAEEAKRAEDARIAMEEAKRIEDARIASELEAQRVEDARIAAELEAKRVEDERIAKEEAKRVEDARIASELEAKKREQEEQIAAEREAKRVEEERIAAELEAKRVEDARIAAELEAQREDERIAKEEAKRIEDARIASELEAKKREQEEQIAAELEAKRLQDERTAAAEEARRIEEARIAAEAAEAQRLADEAAESQRLADEAAESQRLADEAEAQRLAEAAQQEERAKEAAAQNGTAKADDVIPDPVKEIVDSLADLKLAADKVDGVQSTDAPVGESAPVETVPLTVQETVNAVDLASESANQVDPVLEPAKDGNDTKPAEAVTVPAQDNEVAKPVDAASEPAKEGEDIKLTKNQKKNKKKKKNKGTKLDDDEKDSSTQGGSTPLVKPTELIDFGDVQTSIDPPPSLQVEKPAQTPPVITPRPVPASLFGSPEPPVKEHKGKKPAPLPVPDSDLSDAYQSAQSGPSTPTPEQQATRAAPELPPKPSDMPTNSPSRSMNQTHPFPSPTSPSGGPRSGNNYPTNPGRSNTPTPRAARNSLQERLAGTAAKVTKGLNSGQKDQKKEGGWGQSWFNGF